MAAMTTTQISTHESGTADPVVTVRGLTKSYGGRVVVDGLDLDVRAGEVVGLIGANGAGKTTTVECLQGLRRPDAGHVRVLGLDPVTRRRPAASADRQPAAELRRCPTGCGSPRPSRCSPGPRANDADRAAGAVRARAPASLTVRGHERWRAQRLFLVLALLNQPRLVILDELTQGLDPAARREVWSAVAQLRDAGTTVLLVTHELDEAEALCERVVAMRDGRVLDQGTPAELVARHAGEVDGPVRAARPVDRHGDRRDAAGAQPAARRARRDPRSATRSSSAASAT